ARARTEPGGVVSSRGGVGNERGAIPNERGGVVVIRHGAAERPTRNSCAARYLDQIQASVGKNAPPQPGDSPAPARRPGWRDDFRIKSRAASPRLAANSFAHLRPTRQPRRTPSKCRSP